MGYKSPASPLRSLSSSLAQFLCFFHHFPGGIFRGNKQMDQSQTKQALLKKSIQILLSTFAFSILFTLSPLLPLSSHYLGNFSGKIFGYTPDKNCIFLFWNGILAFVIKNSLPAGSSQNQRMDQNQTKQALLKKSIQIVLSSILVFSILFRLSPFLPLSSNYLGNFSSKISSYTPDGNWMLLFWNGILAFLIKKSLVAGSSQNQHVDQSQTKEALLKKSIQFLLSTIIVFSILFPLSALLPISSHYLSNFSWNISSYTPYRNYIFLFCNGILALLIKNSLPAGSSEQNFEQNVQNQQREPELAEKQDSEKDTAREDNGNLIPEEEESEIFVAVEEEEEEEEEDDGRAEELNKKCDDFIRKMREGIMIEAQRRIIVSL